jgi:hypothetical protein
LKAYSWFSIALQSADLDENDKPEALFFRDEIKSHLSPVDLDAADSFIASMQH